MIRFTFIFLVFVFVFTSCKGQIDNDHKYNTKYTIGENRNLNGFATLNSNDTFVDSVMHSYDKKADIIIKNDPMAKKLGFKKRRDFKQNRSRLLLTENVNGKDTVVDKISFDGISSLCECNIKDDTLFIQSAFGMHFAPRRVFAKVFKSNFQAFYHKHNDDYYKPFKLSLNSSFADKVNIDSKFQYLQFDTQPSFEINQQLTGYLTFTSNVFFEKLLPTERVDKKFVTLKMKFTCLTQKQFF